MQHIQHIQQITQRSHTPFSRLSVRRAVVYIIHLAAITERRMQMCIKVDDDATQRRCAIDSNHFVMAGGLLKKRSLIV